LTAGASIRQNDVSALSRSGFKILYMRGPKPMLAFDFPASENGVVSLYTLRGALIKRSGPVSGRGTMALDKGICGTIDGSFLAVWKPARGVCIRGVVTVSR
jgi:hypothetical protein